MVRQEGSTEWGEGVTSVLGDRSYSEMRCMGQTVIQPRPSIPDPNSPLLQACLPAGRCSCGGQNDQVLLHPLFFAFMRHPVLLSSSCGRRKPRPEGVVLSPVSRFFKFCISQPKQLTVCFQNRALFSFVISKDVFFSLINIELIIWSSVHRRDVA